MVLIVILSLNLVVINSFLNILSVFTLINIFGILFQKQLTIILNNI